jgi:hypothetical protein
MIPFPPLRLSLTSIFVSPAVNTRLVRVHGYTPAELFLGFNPSSKKYDLGLVHLATKEEWMSADPAPGHLPQLDDMYRGERRQESMEAIALTNALAEEKGRAKSNARRESFQEGDLVLVRDLRREKVNKDKMTPKWFGPRKLIKVNPCHLPRLTSLASFLC